jgi:hypothetical protein
MSAEQNKAVMRRYFEELWNKGNLAVIDEIVAPGMSLNEEKNTSLEKWRQALSAWLTGVWSRDNVPSDSGRLPRVPRTGDA